MGEFCLLVEGKGLWMTGAGLPCLVLQSAMIKPCISVLKILEAFHGNITPATPVSWCETCPCKTSAAALCCSITPVHPYVPCPLPTFEKGQRSELYIPPGAVAGAPLALLLLLLQAPASAVIRAKRYVIMHSIHIDRGLFKYYVNVCWGGVALSIIMV